MKIRLFFVILTLLAASESWSESLSVCTKKYNILLKNENGKINKVSFSSLNECQERTKRFFKYLSGSERLSLEKREVESVSFFESFPFCNTLVDKLLDSQNLLKSSGSTKPQSIDMTKIKKWTYKTRSGVPYFKAVPRGEQYHKSAEILSLDTKRSSGLKGNYMIQYKGTPFLLKEVGSKDLYQATLDIKTVPMEPHAYCYVNKASINWRDATLYITPKTHCDIPEEYVPDKEQLAKIKKSALKYERLKHSCKVFYDLIENNFEIKTENKSQSSKKSGQK